MAAELISHGVDFSFAPCVDLTTASPRSLGIGLHARASVVSQLAIAYTHGMRDAGMQRHGQTFSRPRRRGGRLAPLAAGGSAELVDLDQASCPIGG